MKELLKNIKTFSDDYLILDGLVPTISLGYIKEEFVLYKIEKENYRKLLDLFYKITDKRVNENYLISELSHGQKLILSSIIVLSSSAKKILFRNFFTSVSIQNRSKINTLIAEQKTNGKIIKII